MEKARSAEQFAQRPESERAQQAAAEARAKAAETQSAAGEDSGGEPRVFKASPEMKRLYREVARCVHPGPTSYREDRVKREQLMAEANLAYERVTKESSRDFDRLRIETPSPSPVMGRARN